MLITKAVYVFAVMLSLEAVIAGGDSALVDFVAAGRILNLLTEEQVSA